MIFFNLLLAILCLAGCIVIIRQTLGRSGKMGINFHPTVCPHCQNTLPAVRVPRSLEQLLWGGWTCPHCGAVLNKWGENPAKPEAKAQAEPSDEPRRQVAQPWKKDSLVPAIHTLTRRKEFIVGVAVLGVSCAVLQCRSKNQEHGDRAEEHPTSDPSQPIQVGAAQPEDENTREGMVVVLRLTNKEWGDPSWTFLNTSMGIANFMDDSSRHYAEAKGRVFRLNPQTMAVDLMPQGFRIPRSY